MDYIKAKVREMIGKIQSIRDEIDGIRNSPLSKEDKLKRLGEMKAELDKMLRLAANLEELIDEADDVNPE